MSVQYKLALASAGMVDNPRRVEPTAARMDRLRAYVEAWKNTRFMDSIIPDPAMPWYRARRCTMWWPSTGGVLPRFENGCQTLFRPASDSRGIPEKTWRMTNLKIHLSYICNIGVDLVQDLLVAVCQIRDNTEYV